MPGLATPRALSPARVRTDPGFSEDSRFAHSVAAASPRIRDASRSAQLRERQIRTPGIRGRGKRSGLRARIHRVSGRRCSTRLSTTTPHLNSTGTETNYRRPERDEEQQTGADGIRIRVRPQAGHGQENDPGSGIQPIWAMIAPKRNRRLLQNSFMRPFSAAVPPCAPRARFPAGRPVAPRCRPGRSTTCRK